MYASIEDDIELDDADVQAIMHRYRVTTKTEAVALALRHLAGQPMTHDEALATRGRNSIRRVPPDRGPRGGASSA